MLCAHHLQGSSLEHRNLAVDPILLIKMAHNGVVNAGSNVHLSAWRSWGFPNIWSKTKSHIHSVNCINNGIPNKQTTRVGYPRRDEVQPRHPQHIAGKPILGLPLPDRD
jgi:hypothetical protein